MWTGHMYVRNMLARDQDPDRFCRNRNPGSLNAADLETARAGVTDFLGRHKFFTILSVGREVLDMSPRIVSGSNVRAPDAIHLAAAWSGRIRILPINDGPFIKEGNRMPADEGKTDLELCSVNRLPGVLRRMGVDPG